MTVNPYAVKLLALSLSTMVLVACDNSDKTLGQKVDSVISETKDVAKQAKSDSTDAVSKSMEKTAEATREGTAKAGEALDDAAITTSITASIAKDPDLSAFKIDVDTKNGRVSMHGSAPTVQARDRAVAIAQSVKGVVHIDNQLTIKPKS